MPARRLLIALLLLCPLALSACANTLQDRPLQPSFLEPLVAQDEYSVYWVGGTFRGLAMTNVVRDPGGAYTIRYGDCREGGQNVCVTPLEIVTSPDNSFRPGGSTPQRRIVVRGLEGAAMHGARTLVLATGAVVIDIYSNSAALARAAAQTMVAINSTEIPGARLPRPLPNTRFADRPLPFQEPLRPPAEPSALASGG